MNNDSGHATQPEPVGRQNVPGSLEDILYHYTPDPEAHDENIADGLPSLNTTQALAALEQYTLRQRLEELQRFTKRFAKYGDGTRVYHNGEAVIPAGELIARIAELKKTEKEEGAT